MTRLYLLFLWALFPLSLVAQISGPMDAAATGNQPAAIRAGISSKVTLRAQAWDVLLAGINESGAEKRATAVRALALLTGERRAAALATHALSDDKPLVRAAAATALGEMHARFAIPKLAQALSDKEPIVMLAAAHSLLTLKDPRAYDVYYEILTGERKGNKGLVAGELDTLRDPKKMALLGFQEGIGFVPFAGIGYSAVRTVMKDDNSPVRAAALKVLSEDHDSVIEQAMIRTALEDKNQLVRIAALDSLAQRGNPAIIKRIVPAMSDDKDAVRYTAAAAVLHLSDIAKRRQQNSK